MAKNDVATLVLSGAAEVAPAAGVTTRTNVLMDTLVTIRVVDSQGPGDVEAAIGRAFAWFRDVEDVCTRFVPTSEVMRLLGTGGVPTPVSAILY